MDKKLHVIILLLFTPFAFCRKCDCKLVNLLRNIVQKEMMEREILASRVDMLESKLGSGTFEGANALEISSDTVILERMYAMERMIENFNTILKEKAKDRHSGVRPEAAFTNAWKIHKREFTLMKEDMNKSLSDNKKSIHDLTNKVEKHIEVAEIKVEQLVNQTSSTVTKQLRNADDRCEVIQSGLSMTFENYKARMNNDFAEFKHNTDRRLYGFHTDILTNDCAYNPCLNGATCIDGIRSYLCICVAGYTGNNCQIEINDCANKPCLNGAICVDEINNYSCRCVPGYVGKNCEIIAYDCKALRDGGITKNGLYNVHLKSSGMLIQVYCDMKTDGGGWTVFQKRYDGSLDFNRSFTEYENGFGNLKGEFWFGLKFIQEMALLGTTEVTIDIYVFVLKASLLIRNFSLDSANLYSLQFSSVVHPDSELNIFNKDYGIEFGNGRCFSTYDRDCDRKGCPSRKGGGWWYNGCSSFDNMNIMNIPITTYLHELPAGTQMMLRRVQS